MMVYARSGWDRVTYPSVAALAGITVEELRCSFPYHEQLGLPILRAGAEKFTAYVYRLLDGPREGFRRTMVEALTQLQVFCTDHVDMLRDLFPLRTPEPIWRAETVGPFQQALIRIFMQYRHVLPRNPRAGNTIREVAERLIISVITLTVHGGQEPYCLHENVRAHVTALRLVGPEVDW